MKPNYLAKALSIAAVLSWTVAFNGQVSTEAKPGENAALRYWSAFAQMQDAAVSPEQAKELQAILEGTAPYSDLKYRDLAERNRRAVETLQRGADLSSCDWGLEYQLGSETPIEYVRKSLALGRINILYSMHQLQLGDRAGGIRSLAAGIRFAHDVATGGPLMAALAGKTLLMTHLRMIDFASVEQALTPSEKALISRSLGRIGAEGVDWQTAIRREFEVLARSGTPVPTAVEEQYRRALQDAGELGNLQKAIAGAPKAVAGRIANPQRVLEQKQELAERLQATRLKLL
jgi:hypothetical protein